MHDITRLLRDIEAGDSQASRDLLPMVYDELRKLAEQRMNAERADHTLQATALVHEAFLRLVDVDQVQSWDSQGHFFSAAAEAMRRILIESARARKAQKRNRNQVQLTHFDPMDEAGTNSPERMIELDDALKKLEQEDPQVAQLVQLRLYGGLSVPQAAQTLKVPRSTAYDWWKYALAWFQVEMADG